MTNLKGVRAVCTMSKELVNRTGEKILCEIKSGSIKAAFAPENSRLKSPAVWFEVKEPKSMAEIEAIAEKTIAKAAKKTEKKKPKASVKAKWEKKTYSTEEKKNYLLKKKDEFNQHILDEIQKQLLSAKAGTLAKTFQYQWEPGKAPHNGVSGYKYRGINRILCNFWMWHMKSADPRFYTGKQIYKLDVEKGMNLKIKDGEKGHTLQLEFWFLKDMDDNVVVTSSADRKKREEAGHRLVWCTRYIEVYNACQIDNLPPFDSDHIHEDVKADDLIWDIAAGMNVPLYMDTLDEAYYSPGLDEVHVPLQERFKSSAGCSHTCAHELAHASGHKKRLNYLEPARFGSEDYAEEELRAEITACLLSAYTKEGLGQLEFENSNAYLDSWLAAVKDRPNSVVTACKRAAKSVDYMLAAAGYSDPVPETEFD